MTKPNTKSFPLKPLAASLAALGFSTVVLAAPQDGVVRAGSASISQSGSLTQIQQNSDRAVIDWRSFSVGALESVAFNQPTRQSATLNRVTGDQVSTILGKISANGQVVLINPNGIVFGAGAQINVGGLIASTANISNKNFMDGRLEFDQPGKPGASILNQGTISAADGGLVALVAPSVRNDGIIQARLGKIALGAGDTFTIDLYGDQLINLALSPEQAAHIVQTGQIHADGGHVVLVTAPTAKAVLDQVINMSGTIRADSIAEHNGKIVLLGAGGEVAVSGQLSAQGQNTGERGGSIAVLGDTIHLADSANLDASGAAGGGTIHVGGAWQGSGDTYRAQHTDIAAGARLAASATDSGDGGEVVVWSDQDTRYAGAIAARGGANGGNGGQIEVSGKGTLEFLGSADASAPRGRNGALLLDPTDVNIGLAEASTINRVLRTGTSTTVQASNNIDVNALIDGRGYVAGGGLTLTAGNNLNINEFIVTNNGAVNLNAGGTLSVAADKAVFAGNAAISASSGGDLNTVPLISTGAVTYRSTGGSVLVNRAIDSGNRNIAIHAAQNVAVNQPIVSLLNGSPLEINAGGDITVNAQIDGRGGAGGGAVTLNAGGNIALNEFTVTNNGSVNVTAGGTLTFANGKGILAGSAPISASSAGNLFTGPVLTSNTATFNSSGGSVFVNQAIGTDHGAIVISAAQDVNVNQAITNFANGSTLSISTTGGDIVVDAQIDGRGGMASGSVSLSAGDDVLLNQNIVTQNAALTLNAGGAVTPSGGAGLFAGNGAIGVTSGDTLSSGIYTTTGALNLRSTGGNVNVDTKIDEATGNTTIQAAGAVNVNQAIANIRNGSDLSISAGTNIVVNAQIDAQDDVATLATPVAGGTVTLSAGNNVTLNDNIATFNGAVNVTASSGTLTFKPGTVFTGDGDAKRIYAGSAPITITTGGDFTTGEAPPMGLTFAPPPMGVDTLDYIADSLRPWVTLVTTGKLTLTSTNGNVSVDAPIPNTTGEIEINAGNGVVVNHKIITNSNPVTINAGAGGVIVNPNVNGDDYGLPTGASAAIDTKDGNLTIRSTGNINIVDSIASNANIILDTRGALLRGSIIDSNGSGARPDNVLISADQGIGTTNTFFAGSTPNLEAYSLSGSIAINTTATRLRLGTGFDASACINTPGTCVLDPLTFPTQGGAVSASGAFSGFLGDDVLVVAGGQINIPNLRAGNAVLTSSQSIPFKQVYAGNITARAIGDITFDTAGTSVMFEQGNVYLGGALSATSTTGNVSFNNDAAVHLGDGFDLNLTATAGSVTVRRTELNGDVIVNAGQDITFLNPIGADIRDAMNAVVAAYANGVSGVDLNAGNNINIQGARSSGLIDIDAVGSFTSNGMSVFSTSMLMNPVTINSTNVTFAGSAYLGTSIATQTLLLGPAAVAPAIPPGPQVSPPGLPAALSAAPNAAPGTINVADSGTPGGLSLGGIGAPGAGGDSSSTLTNSATTSLALFDEIIPETTDKTTTETQETSGTDTLKTEANSAFVVFPGGRGVAQLADLGRGSALSVPPDVFTGSSEEACDESKGPCK